MATCPHGKEVCADCAKLLTVPEAVQYRADHPGTTQAEAAEMAGVTRRQLKMRSNELLQKRPMCPNVTGSDPTKRPYYDVDWPTVVPPKRRWKHGLILGFLGGRIIG